MCQKCGTPDYIQCDCDTSQAFCTPCATEHVCAGEIDASCVIYHIDGDDDTRPSLLTCLNLPNGTNVQSILEAIDDLICNQGNVPITVTETFTAAIVADGAANHHLRVNVKVSDDTSEEGNPNIIEIRPDGLFATAAPDTYKVKVDEDDDPDFLIDQVEGDISEFLEITVTEVAGKLRISPVFDLELLCEAINNCKCSQTVTTLGKTFSPACPTGYSLNTAGTACIKVETTDATINETLVTACEQFRAEYSAYGALVYKAGFYDTDGTGTGSTLGADLSANRVTAITTPDVWLSDNSTGNNNGPANRAGIWNCNYTATGTTENPEVLGFSVPIDVPTTKTYYIGIAADNDFQVTVNGVTIIDSALSVGDYWPSGQTSKFRYWHIYPIQLNAGVNYLGLYAKDYGVDALLAAEIYDNTLAQLQAAILNPSFVSDPVAFPLDQNHYSNLNLLFTTRCARSGATFSIGNATCPDNSWSLDTTGGDPLVPPCQGINSDTSDWECKRTLTAVFDGYSVTLVWDRLNEAVSYDVQQKLTSQTVDDYVTSTGSPVQNPVSGGTVDLTIDNLPSNSMNFRVRPNYGNCYGPWQEI